MHNRPEKKLAKTCKVIQYADDTLLFCDYDKIKNALELLQKSCQDYSLYFTKHSVKHYKQN